MDATINPARTFSAPYAEDDALLARKLLAETSFEPARKQKVDALARDLIEAIRAGSRGLGGIEDMLHEYALTTPRGARAHGSGRGAVARPPIPRLRTGSSRTSSARPISPITRPVPACFW